MHPHHLPCPHHTKLPPLCVLSAQVVSDYLTGFDDPALMMQAGGKPVVVYTYRCASSGAHEGWVPARAVSNEGTLRASRHNAVSTTLVLPTF